MAEGYTLAFTCRDAVGIVAAVTGALAGNDGFILDSQQYADLETGRFFMRLHFQSAGPKLPPTRDGVAALIAPVAAQFGFDWRLVPADHRPKMLIAASKQLHCLHDLLYRWQTGALPVDIAGVTANHEDGRALAERHGLPFFPLPTAPAAKAERDAELQRLMRETGADYLVLARYMQVLGADLVQSFPGRIVNIHHSFLPGFVGAKPYHRAHDRGVKLIGATAHFVTEELDEGPIIEQAVERVDHRASVEELIAIGRDIEAQVLSRAVAWVAQQRVFPNNGRTVVFR
ncbi:formyltetrahydrofolate deformylase [Sandaracinobacter sp. RS1-74]|uniref:formyltetrahydrofolate deformylase n=1 Tax=Sandaracinobacteroides sayramensis TaxID=2913411 RepID=UPI001EDC17E6|nr:formyltetrahydrofolate deformylase [Sandaracinobacteroides sayramensis]MCG2839865.1 formyltetrahydrofolate deformylase [Sandaracinobacteroides sayramensis]